MDNTPRGQPSTGAGAGAADAGDGSNAGGDWRSKLLPEARGRIVIKIMDIMKKHLPAPVSMPEVLAEVEVQKLAERFEEKIFAAAVNQSDYMRKICLKMINIKSHNKTNTQEIPQDVQVVQNQRLYDLVSRGSTSHAGDLKEELSQMNKILKDQYLAGLGRDNAVPTQEQIQVPEEFPGRQGMDNIQGGEPSTGARAGTADAGGDWRSILLPEARDRIVNKITKTLKEHLPVSLPEGLAEVRILRKIAERFEEKIFAVAVSQSDYLRKISLKMLTMESRNKTNTQENLQDVQVVQNQRPGDIASRGSTSQFGSSNAGDLKKELSQMNKMLKDQYLAGLGDLYETYIQLGRDNPVTTQGPIQVPEEVNFKLILERSLDSVQISKKPSLEESTPSYMRDILSIINSEEWLPEQPYAGQALGTSSSGVRAANGTLSPERGNAKRLRFPLKDDVQS